MSLTLRKHSKYCIFLVWNYFLAKNKKNQICKLEIRKSSASTSKLPNSNELKYIQKQIHRFLFQSYECECEIQIAAWIAKIGINVGFMRLLSIEIESDRHHSLHK